MQFNVQPNIPDNEINEEQSGTTTHISKPQQTDWTVSITTQNASNIIHQSNAAPSSSDQSNIETQPRAEAKNATPVNNSIHSPIQEDSCNNAAPFFAKKQVQIRKTRIGHLSDVFHFLFSCTIMHFQELMAIYRSKNNHIISGLHKFCKKLF